MQRINRQRITFMAVVEKKISNDIESEFGSYKPSFLQQKILNISYKLPYGNKFINWTGKSIASLLKGIFLKFYSYQVVDGVIHDMKWRLYLSGNFCERKFFFAPQYYDVTELKYMHEYLPKGGVFIDIGANVGIYSLHAAKILSENGKVLSFEPNPFVLERFNYNLSVNEFTDRVITEQIGISDSKGEFELNLGEGNLGQSSLIIKRDGDVINIKCDRLINILQKYSIEKIDGLKIDIEGAEDKALIPFLNEAPKAMLPKFIIIENSDDKWEKDLTKEIYQAGYELKEETKRNQIWTL